MPDSYENFRREPSRPHHDENLRDDDAYPLEKRVIRSEGWRSRQPQSKDPETLHQTTAPTNNLQPATLPAAAQTWHLAPST